MPRKPKAVRKEEPVSPANPPQPEYLNLPPIVPRICEYCGTTFEVPRQQVIKGRGKFCSGCCRAKAQSATIINYNKSEICRERTALRNKDPAFRKKVSAGLKKRKERLGDDYHSVSAKAKIGNATKARWNDVRSKILPVLIWNGQSLRKKDNFPYGHQWRFVSKKARELSKYCFRCLSSKNLVVHHIIPARFGGKAELNNALVLCSHCHPTVDRQALILYDIFKDWEKTRALLKERIAPVATIAIAKTVYGST